MPRLFKWGHMIICYVHDHVVLPHPLFNRLSSLAISLNVPKYILHNDFLLTKSIDYMHYSFNRLFSMIITANAPKITLLGAPRGHRSRSREFMMLILSTATEEMFITSMEQFLPSGPLMPSMPSVPSVPSVLMRSVGGVPLTHLVMVSCRRSQRIYTKKDQIELKLNGYE